MRLHYLAFKALVEGRSGLAGKVFSSVRITNGQPVSANYVVLFPDSPADLDDARFTAVQRAGSRARYRYDVRVVAVDAEGMLMLADAVMGLVGLVPSVAGRVCERIRLVPAVEEGKGRHDSVTGLHFMDLTFEFWSRPVAS